MDPAGYLGLEATADPLAWRLPVEETLTTGGGTLFGGIGLGASVAALEMATERPLVWATAQYLSHARPPATLDLVATVAAAGRQMTQARVVASVEGTEIFTVNAAFGSQQVETARTWTDPPDVPPPDALPTREPPAEMRTRISGRIQLRLPEGEPGIVPGNGRTAMWARMEGLDMSSALLAVFGDMVPFAVNRLVHQRGSAISLDNTLRVVRLVPSDWVLVDIRVHAIHHGFGHGGVHLWAQDGTLLGTAGQSVMIRPKAD